MLKFVPKKTFIAAKVMSITKKMLIRQVSYFQLTLKHLAATKVSIRYTNGGSNDRPAFLLVDDDQYNDDFYFSATGDRLSWRPKL
jgi:hypothetical protein